MRSHVNFQLLQERLLAFVAARVQRGDYTERGLARIIGVSQPQIHNLLKGKRRLQPAVADRIMSKFEIDILDLLDDHEVRIRLVAGPLATRTLAFDDREPPRKRPGRITQMPEDLAG